MWNARVRRSSLERIDVKRTRIDVERQGRRSLLERIDVKRIDAGS